MEHNILTDDILYQILLYMDIDDIIRINTLSKNVLILDNRHFWVNKMAHDNLLTVIDTDDFNTKQWIALYLASKNIKTLISRVTPVYASSLDIIVTQEEFNDIRAAIPSWIPFYRIPETITLVITTRDYGIMFYTPRFLRQKFELKLEQLYYFLYQVYYHYPEKYIKNT